MRALLLIAFQRPCFCHPSRLRQTRAIRACSLLSKAKVKTIAGVTDQFVDMVAPKEEPLSGGGSACSYSGIHIQIDPFTPARLEELRKQKGHVVDSGSGCGRGGVLVRQQQCGRRTPLRGALRAGG